MTEVRGQLSPREQILRLQELADYIVPFAVRAVCDLRIADHMSSGPRHVDDLAQRSGAHASVLQRVLRALACKEIFTEVEPGWFGLTPLAALLRSDHPLSLREAYTMIPANFEAWAHFMHTVHTGEPAFPHVHGHTYYEHLARSPGDSERYDAIQRAGNRLELRMLVRSYDWSELTSIVDIGGNDGAFLAALLRRNPELRGVVVDLPHVVGRARETLDVAGVLDRCDVVGADFFDGVPDGHAAYLLKRVLYDWPDAEAAKLLRTVAAAMRAGSRLLLIDPVIEPGDEFDPGKIYDLLSLATLGGKARSRAELEELCEASGLRVVRTVETGMLPILDIRLAGSR